MEKLSVIKIGGKVIENKDYLDQFLKDISAHDSRKILVHGGGKQIDQFSKKLGVPVNMIDGRRVTNPETLEVTQMVLAGLLNKNIVSLLQGFGVNAIGLSGADGDLIRASKRKITKGIDYGMVGDIKKINFQLIIEMIDLNLFPVIASMSHDGSGNMLNTNADTVAAEIAISLSAHFHVELVYCLDLPGLLRNVEDPSSLISEINRTEYESLKASGSISKGMIPKIDNAFDSLERGVNRVILINTDHIDNFLNGTVTKGTVIRN